MFKSGKNNKNEYNEAVNLPERIIAVIVIILFAAVIVLCIFKFIFKEPLPEAITPNDYTEFAHDSDFSKNVYGEVRTPNMENTPSDPDEPTPISCWGDSYTIAADYSTPSYVAYLSKNAVRICYNLGVNQGTIEDIAARQGGAPLYVLPFDIPAKVDYREISVSNSYGYEPKIDFDKNSGFNPCKIDGIEGILSQFYGTYKFTRLASGFEDIILEPTPVITKAMELRKNDITVLFIGNTNNFVDDAKTIEIYKRMTEFLDTDKFLVIGPIVGNVEKIKKINSDLSAAFGIKFLDLYSYLYNDAVVEYEVTINEEDKASIAKGNIPANFVLNGKGFSKQGAEIVGNKVFDKLNNLGYFDEESENE